MIHDFWQKVKKHSGWLLLIFLLIWGLYWRSYDWRSYSLGFDQVQILSNAERITSGNFTLIGPRTGPASLFTGPLIYYLTALILVLSNPVFAAVFVPVLLASTSSIVLFFLVKHYFDFRSALILILIWATTPLLLYLDRIFWNPNISLLAFSLVLFPIMMSKKANRIDLLLVALGSFLSYQAHFSAFILIPIVLVLWLVFKIDKRYLLAFTLGLGLSLLPTFVFDLRHDWLNTRGLLGFSSQRSEQFSLILLIENLFKNLAIIAETFGKLFYQFATFQQRVLFGSLLLTVSLYLAKKNRIISLWPSLTVLLITAGCLALYQGNNPEYYFLMITPILFIIVLLAFKKAPNSMLMLFTLSQLVLSRQFMLEKTRNNLDLSLGNCLEISAQVTKIQETQGISFLAYDLPFASDFGLKYLIEPLILDEDGKIVHLFYPAPEETSSWQRIGQTAIIIEE